jgi:hypothetical protein
MFAVEGKFFQSRPSIALAKIDSVVSARLGTTRVMGNAQPAVFNRQIAMYLAKHVGGWSTTVIGRFYNGRDHSTVCHALKRVAALRDADPEMDGLLATLTSEIRAAAVERSVRPERPIRTAAVGTELRYNDAFLDALADRLAIRILSRLHEIQAASRSDNA